MKYRIKNPRCWVLRWRYAGVDPSTDYLRGTVRQGRLTDRAGATEYPTVGAAIAAAAAVGGRSRFWRVARRGRPS